MPLLTGLTADGTEVPVQVEPDGVLVAEGIQGAPGPQGPEGPQGPKGDPGTPGTLPFGTYAWASTAADGTIKGGNGLTCLRTNDGFYTYTLSTPLPDSNYAVTCTTTRIGSQSGWFQVVVDNPSTTQFGLIIAQDSGTTITTQDKDHSVIVTAAFS